MNIRYLHKQDLLNAKFRTHFFELLDTTELEEEMALFVFMKRGEFAKTFVGTDDQDLPIATVSLVLERKFIRGGMLYGHIEDVNVHPNHQTHGFKTMGSL